MHSRRLLVTMGLVAVAALSVGGSKAGAQFGRKNFRAELEGAQETPAISTEGTGEFRARLDDSGTQLEYELQYSGLEGGNTLFAHVHIGQTGVAGGVMFFLCGGGGKPACPNGEATINGTVTAANVIGPAGQGISAGQFDEAVRAMRNGLAYANVHTTSFASGEIRGQIK